MGKKWGWAILTAIMLAICALGLAEGDDEDAQSFSEPVVIEQSASDERDAAEDDATVTMLNTFSACEHTERKQTGGTQKNQTVVDNGNGTHTRSFDVYHFYTCTACGDVEERFIERGEEIEEHVFRGDGTCAECGAKKPCEHSWSEGKCTKCGQVCTHPERKQTGGTQKNQTTVDNGNGTHTRSFDVYHLYTCTTCGDVEERFVEKGTETEEHVWKSDDTCAACGAKKPCEEHSWSDGVCTECGEVCTHAERKQTGGTQKNQTTVDNGNGTHTRSFDVYHLYTCTTCGDVEERFIERGEETEEHDFRGGESCIVCGAKKPCEHVWNDGVCTKCGEACKHSWNDGVCTVCGYVCQHPQSMLTYNDEKSWEEAKPSVAENEKTHTDYCISHDVFDCACGKEIEKLATGFLPEQPHTWNDGACTACGYVCQHPKEMLTWNEEKSWAEPNGSEPENEKTHTDYAILHDVYDCACGKEFAPGTSEGWIPEQPHIWSDGVCTACGYVCQHPQDLLTLNESKSQKTVLESRAENDRTHTDHCLVSDVYDCACGKEYTEESIEDIPGQMHRWSDGECIDCGYVCQHPQNMLTYNDEKSWEEAKPSVAENEKTHTDHYVVHDVFDCACGKEFMPPAYEGSAPGQPHRWSKGQCVDCGHVCQHPETLLLLSRSEKTVLESRAENGKTHTDHCLVTDVYDCACGKEYTAPEYIEDIPGQPHSWSDGECTACGYVCEHPEDMLTYNASESWNEVQESTAENGKTHTDHYMNYDMYDCACGKKYAAPPYMTSVSGQMHSWNDGECIACGYVCGHSWSDGVCTNCGKACEHSWSDGVCTVCGYVCQHPEHMLTLNESKSEKTVLESRAENGKTHTDHCLVSDVYDCACGREYTEEYIEDIPGQPHTWSDGACTACGYACAHEEIEADGEPVRTDGALVYIDQNTHAQSFTLSYSMKCVVCGAPAGTMTGSGRDAAVAHAYHNNVCACGAVEYVPEDDNNNTGNTGNNTGNRPVQPVEQPEDKDEDLVITEPPRASMVETLVDTVAEAEASGSEVKVEIVGAEQAMTAEEYAQLQTLPVQEQVLVTLASIGFEDAVTAAMQTMNNVQLSDDAQNLMDSVAARTAAATPEERRQMEAKLEQYFPKREIEVNGVTYPYFVMELQIEVDGKLSVVRYGFRMDDKGEWIFVMLDQI